MENLRLSHGSCYLEIEACQTLPDVETENISDITRQESKTVKENRRISKKLS